MEPTDVILAIETSASKCSVAVLLEGLIYQEEAEEAYSHVSMLNKLIDRLLRVNAISYDMLTGVVISKGPGSYTGLRVGSSTAKGLCYALDIPLVAVDTLYAIAHKHFSEDQKTLIVPVIDARRNEVYMSVYNESEDQIVSPTSCIVEEGFLSDYADAYDKIKVIGNAADKCKQLCTLDGVNYVQSELDASQLLQASISSFEAADYQNLSSFTPFYLKPPNITVSRKKVFRNI